MKTRIIIDIEASQTIIDTMKRTGFTVRPDGSAMQIVVPNAPSITKRKNKITFLDNSQIDTAIT